MSTNYPTSQDSYTVHQDGGIETVTASDVNNLQDAVVAIEQTLGSGTSKPTSTPTAGAIVKYDASGNLPGSITGNAPTATNASQLGGNAPSYYLAATAQAADSSKLGGQAPSYYATASQANSSASGTWTPASGTFNRPQGTVINVAAVPGGANMYMCMFGGGQQPVGTSPSMVGVTTSAGSSWLWGSTTSSGNIGAAYSNGISGSTNGSGNPVLYDGTYSTQGYFQINGGYLQFVCAIAGSASAGAADTIRWAVS